jgi:hypothetical protein
VSAEATKRKKRRSSYAERYAVWLCHGPKCWWCHEPLRIWETTIDHVLPESLLDDEAARRDILTQYGLPESFNINGYENWLPCHTHCNQQKGAIALTFVPGHKAILDRLKSKAGEAERAARSVTANIAKDKVFRSIFAGLEQRTISVRDLEDLLQAFVEDPRKAGMSEDGLLLDSGYWFPRDQIVHEGLCRCERNACVGYNKKIYCYFEASLSPWVVKTGLFWRCYDEVIACPRCADWHKRGHIGRVDVCGRPYLNQAAQNDSAGAGGV